MGPQIAARASEQPARVRLALGALACALGFVWLQSSVPALHAIAELGFPGFQASPQGRNGALQLLQAVLVLGAFGALLALARASAGVDTPLGALIRRPAFWAWLVVAASGVFHVWQSGFDVDGERVFSLEDDAMISMRYARNWAQGAGLVWNPGERVEGYSNFLWVCVMAVPHWLGVSENWSSLWIMAVSFGLLSGCVLALAGVASRLGLDPVISLFLLLAFGLDANLAYWTRSGLETTLLAFLVSLCAYALFAERRWLFLAALAAMPLVRADAALLAFSLGLVFLYRDLAPTAFRDPARVLRSASWLALSVIPSLLHLGFRVAYYGEWVPNTYYAKVGAMDGLWQVGVAYAMRLVDGYVPLLLLAGAAFWLSPSRGLVRGLLAVCAVVFTYVVSVGGDALPLLRFLTPILPLLYIAAAGTLVFLSEVIPGTLPRTALAALLLAAMPWAGHGGRLFELPTLQPLRPNVWAARLIERNTDPGTTVSLSVAGIIPYFAEQQRFVDTLGLNDPHIARVDPQPGNLHVGHNKFDFTYVYDERRPDLVLTMVTCDWVARLLDGDTGSSDPFGTGTLHAIAEFTHPSFRAHYYPAPIVLADGREDVSQFGCLFARTDSLVRRTWTPGGEPARALRLDFDRNVPGSGWAGFEQRESGTLRWTRAGQEARLDIAEFALDRPLWLEIRVAGERSDLALSVHGRPVELDVRADPGFTRYLGRLPASQRDRLRVSLRAARPVAIDWMRVAPPEAWRRRGLAAEWEMAGR